MGEVYNFSETRILKENNLKKLEIFEKKFINKLNQHIGDIKEKYNVTNFNLLLDRFYNVMNKFKTSFRDFEKLTLFLERLNVVKKIGNNEIDFIYSILYFFNCYSIYGGDYIKLSESDIEMSIYLYATYEQGEKLEEIDMLLDGFLKPELMDRLKKCISDKKKIMEIYSVAYDDYLDTKKDNIPLRYYLEKYIEYYEEEKLNSNGQHKFFSKIILTPENIYNEIKENVEGYAALLHYNGESRGIKEQVQRAIDIMNSLDTMVFKLKNIEEPERTECLIYIREVWTNDKNNLNNKICLTFDEIEKLYYKNEKKNKK